METTNKATEDKVVTKGWEIDLSQIEEGFVYSKITCAANTRNEAKSLLLKKDGVEGMMLRFSEKEVDYLSLPVIRCENADIILYKGEEMSRYKAEQLRIREEHNNELDAILANEKISHCYIKKRGSYYGDNYGGYTEHITRAGVYTKEKAVSHARGILEITIVPINIEEHNERIFKSIEELRGHLILTLEV